MPIDVLAIRFVLPIQNTMNKYIAYTMNDPNTQGS